MSQILPLVSTFKVYCFAGAFPPRLGGADYELTKAEIGVKIWKDKECKFTILPDFLKEAFFFQINSRGNYDKVLKIDVYGASILYLITEIEEEEEREFSTSATTSTTTEYVDYGGLARRKKRSVIKKDEFLKSLSSDGWVRKKGGVVSSSCPQRLNMIWMKTISKKGPVTVTMPKIKTDDIKGALFIAGIIITYKKFNVPFTRQN